MPLEAGKGRKRLSLEPPCNDIRNAVVTLCLTSVSPSVKGRKQP